MLGEYLRGDEFFQIDFGKCIERFCHTTGRDIRIVRNEQRLMTEIQGGMVIATGMAMVSILMISVRAGRAVIVAFNIEDTDLVGSRMP